ncbi:unnamed protein product [Lactuca saligna]|uniref:Uncharacterized protein n=1 Tax=Lactuca saligna TaxID=75948 RepID=A0AA35UVY9_LACSI|nr:unnamed protein product [Lactuca saligna]
MLLLVQGVGQQCSIPDDNIMESIRQVVTKDIPEPAFVRHQRPRLTEPDQSEPTLDDVMRHQDFAHEEHCWINDSMDGVKQRLGNDHPPFLLAVPTVPPPP